MSLAKSAVIALLSTSVVGLLWLGPRADQTLPKHRVVIDYWEKWTGDEGAPIQQVVDDYNNTRGKEVGVFVRYVSTSTVNQKTLVATAAGVPPDVAGLWDANLVQFASLDALEPLDDLAAQYGFTSALYKPVYWNALHWDGHLYGLISTPATIALHYNKDIFQENAAALRAAGLDPNQAPQTLQDLDRYAKILDQRDKHGNIIRLGYLPLEPGWYVQYMYMWFGGDIWDAEHHRFTLTDPRVVASFKWIQSYSKRIGVNAMNEFRSGVAGGTVNWASPQNPFFTGAVAMIQQGPWMANHILNYKPSMDGLTDRSQEDLSVPLAQRLRRIHWGVAPLPSAVPGLKDVTFATFDCLVIPRGTKHKKEAFDFIAYMNRQDVMEKICNLHSKNSALAKVSQNFLEHSLNPYVNIFEELAWSPNAHAVPQIPTFPEVVDELNDLVQRVAIAEEDPETDLRVSQRRLQDHYDKFMQEQKQRHQEQADGG